METNSLWLILSISVFTVAAQADPPSSVKPPLTLVTTTDGGSAVRLVDNQVPNELPGYRAELIRKAGENCGLSVQFLSVPWNRALHMVEYGAADGAFRASYKAERAEYGVYPRTDDGKVDTGRTISDYTYSFFTLKQSDFLWGGQKLPSHANIVAVEASASIINKLEEVGAEVIEARNYQNMLELLMSHRVDAITGITANIEQIMESSSIDYSSVVRVDPPLSENQSYVLISKITYEKRAQDVECFWTEVATLKGTSWYLERKEYYENNF